MYRERENLINIINNNSDKRIESLENEIKGYKNMTEGCKFQHLPDICMDMPNVIIFNKINSQQGEHSHQGNIFCKGSFFHKNPAEHHYHTPEC